MFDQSVGLEDLDHLVVEAQDEIAQAQEAVVDGGLKIIYVFFGIGLYIAAGLGETLDQLVVGTHAEAQVYLHLIGVDDAEGIGG